ncbi:MAG: methylglyoxal synthase [Candidatus Izemoplasma sp.]|nr:methylglyoxal synthase [Candidatus Izemoplasma sp.]
MKIAIIAHDKKKKEMIQFCQKHENILKNHQLFATGTTGHKVMEATDLVIHCYRSGPLGGDQEIGARVANGDIDIILFFRDPLTAQPHEPDVQGLFRLSDVYKIPLASNINTAEMFFKTLK